MPELTPAIRMLVIKDILKHAKSVGAYQAYEWIESHLRYLEAKAGAQEDGHRNRTGNDSQSQPDS